jgi:hypothetical protein
MAFACALLFSAAAAQYYVVPAAPAPTTLSRPSLRIAPSVEAAYGEAPVVEMPTPPTQTDATGLTITPWVAVFALGFGAVAAVRPVAMFSHFSSIKTKFYDRDILMTSLIDLGMKPKANDDGSEQTVRGWRGKSMMAEIVVEQSNGYDIGFKQNAEKQYELISDLEFWEQRVPESVFMERLSQRYSTNKVLDMAEEKGFEVAQQTVNADGTIRIKLESFVGM